MCIPGVILLELVLGVDVLVGEDTGLIWEFLILLVWLEGEAWLSTDGGMVIFILLGHRGRALDGEISGWQWL